jgi:hypothetical protein
VLAGLSLNVGPVLPALAKAAAFSVIGRVKPVGRDLRFTKAGVMQATNSRGLHCIAAIEGSYCNALSQSELANCIRNTIQAQ